VAGVGILLFLAAYIWAAVSLAALVPDLWWAKVLYFAVAGTAWGLPIIPLISWAEKGPGPRS
jgi:hypothetical protein